MYEQLTPYYMYMMIRFAGRNIVGPGTFCEKGLALVRGLGLVFIGTGILFFRGMWESDALLFYGLFLVLDAFQIGILAVYIGIWNRTVKRDFDKQTLILANAMPYTFQGGNNTAILFIHGFGDTPETWQLIAPRVHSLANVTCRAMRLPFVSTTLRQQHHAHLGDWLVAIREEVANLRRWNKRVFIAGHGMGAGLALLATRDDPKLADGVCALSPQVRAKRASRILFWLADNFFVFTRVLPNPFRGVIKTKDGRVYSHARDPFVAFSVYRAFLQMTRRLDAALEKESAVPVVGFVSSRDRVIDVPAVMRFFSGADVYTTKKAGHFLTLDAGWEKRAKRIADFCAQFDVVDARVESER